MGFKTEKNIVKPLSNEGLDIATQIQDVDDNPLETVNNDGKHIFNILAGTSSRAAEVGIDGSLSATKEFIEWIVDVSQPDTQSRNLTTDTWLGNSFERDGIEGQWGLSGNYEYRCVSSFGLWTRYPANKEYQDVFITDADVIASLTNEANWNFSGQYIETSLSVLSKIYNGQWYFSPFYDYKYFVYDIGGKKILREKVNEFINSQVLGVIGDSSLGFIIPAGYKLVNILFQEINGLASPTIALGTTSAGTDVDGSIIVPSGGFINLDNMTLTSFFSPYFDTEIFVSSADWTDVKLNLFIKTQRVV